MNMEEASLLRDVVRILESIDKRLDNLEQCVRESETGRNVVATHVGENGHVRSLCR